MVSKLAPLASARVAAALRKGIAELFSSYTTALGTAFARHRGADGRFLDALGASLIAHSPVPGCEHETPGVFAPLSSLTLPKFLLVPGADPP